MDGLCVSSKSVILDGSAKGFAVGDHVFSWCSFLGVPFSFQQHAIVVAVDPAGDSTSRSAVVILNFDQEEGDNGEAGGDENSGHPKSSRSIAWSAIAKTNQEQRRCHMALQKISLDEAYSKWEHVEYSQGAWHKRLLLRAGTCSPAETDPVPVILCRIRFLLQQSNKEHLVHSLLYHPNKRNGECLAVWCTTGTYYSWQGCAKMGEAGAHVGSFSLVGGVAAQMVASVVVPVVLPLMAAYDVGQAVQSARDLKATREEWNQRTKIWNELFERQVLESIPSPNAPNDT